MATTEEFMAAVKAGDESTVEQMLDENPLLAREVDDGVPALMLAAYHGHPTLAAVIAARKGYLSLFEAAVVGDGEYLESMLSNDASNVNSFSSDGFTALGYAAFFGHLEAAKVLLRRGADPAIASKNPLGVMPLHSALANSHVELVHLLVRLNAPLNTPNREGWTPLHYTAHSGNADLTEFLLLHGSFCMPGPGGKTPADFAAAEGHAGLAERLKGC